MTIVIVHLTLFVSAGVVPLSGNGNYPYNSNNNPNAPSAPSGGLYPNVPGRSQTSTRPPQYRPSGSGGTGYQGGAVGSGYPGQGSQSGYPGSGYPGQ